MEVLIKVSIGFIYFCLYNNTSIIVDYHVLSRCIKLIVIVQDKVVGPTLFIYLL